MATPTSDAIPLVAPDGGTLEDEFINGLVQGGAWTWEPEAPQVLTFSFNINNVDSLENPQPGPGGEWTDPGNAPIADAVRQALALWANVANISFQEVTSGEYYFESTADLSFTLAGSDLSAEGIAGLAFFPDPDYADATLIDVDPNDELTRENYANPEGDVFLGNDLSDFDFVMPGGSGFEIILHEIGHALGLKHPSDDGGNFKPTFNSLGIGAYDSALYTLMRTNLLVDPVNAATPMLVDILAIQHVYGANMSYNTGDDVYALDNNRYSAIWDAGGTDTIDASMWAGLNGVRINLGHWTFSGDRLGARRTGIALDVTLEDAVGSNYADEILGNDASNVLAGGFGADTMTGFMGDDTYIVQDAGDVIVEGVGQGLDVVQSQVSHVLAPNVENLILQGSAVDSLYLNISGTGNDLSNVMSGDQFSNAMSGQGGDDSIAGEAGNDDLQGGDGNDTLRGGSGLDMLAGGAGTDVLDAGPGIDTMAGGSGDDTYIVSDVLPSSYIFWNPPPGSSTSVYVDGGAIPFTYSLTDNSLDGLIDVVSISYNTFGSPFIFGNVHMSLAGTGQNMAPGVYAHDPEGSFFTNPQLNLGHNGSGGGGSGDITIYEIEIDYGATPVLTRLWADFALGLSASGGTVKVNMPVEIEPVLEGANEGSDTIRSSVSAVLPANVEHLVLTGTSPIDGTGNELPNRVRGNGAANILAGGAGNDTIEGDEGADTADYGNESAGVAVSLMSGIATGVSAGADELTGIENVHGSQFDDTIQGDGAVNLLDGAGGNDTLDGGPGIDTLAGGAGDDTHLLKAAAMAGVSAIRFLPDVVQEAPDEGMDTVYSNSSYTLPDGVENLVLSGAAFWRAETGTGNALDNEITATGTARNRLHGEGGDDTLAGGAGRDTLEGGDGADVFLFDTLPDADTILDFASGTDELWLDDAILSMLSPGLVAAENVQIGEESQIGAGSGNAGDGEDYLKYATDTGNLYYDADGLGAGAIALIATVYSPGLVPAGVIDVVVV